jgi:hypothetical protein
MRIQRKEYLKMKDENEKYSKEKLMSALADMENAINQHKQRSLGIDESAERI